MDRPCHLPHDVCRRLPVLKAGPGQRAGPVPRDQGYLSGLAAMANPDRGSVRKCGRSSRGPGRHGSGHQHLHPGSNTDGSRSRSRNYSRPAGLGSYELIRNVFRWLALTLLAYVASGMLAKPNLGEVLYGTFVPTVQFSGEFLSMLVAVIGTTLSAYLYTWQSNVEVEEEILEGHTKLE